MPQSFSYIASRRQDEIPKHPFLADLDCRAAGWLQEAPRADTYAGAYPYAADDASTTNGYPSARWALSSDAYAYISATNSLPGAAHTYTHATYPLSYGMSAWRWVRLQMLSKKLIQALLLSLAIFISGCAPSIVEMDNTQERLDKAAPIIAGPQVVGQTFVSHYPNLSTVELLLVVYADANTLRPLTFHLRSSPQDKTDLVTVAIDTSALRHNDRCRFSFAPQADSENKTYYFFLEAPWGNNTTVWYSSLDAYGEGTLYLNGQPSEGDLYFKTYYEYTLKVMARDIGHGLRSSGWLILPIFALFILPGYLLYSLLPSESGADPVEHLALVVGLSLAVLPLVFLFCSVVGFALNGTRVLIAVVAMSIGAFWRLASTGFRDFRRWLSSDNRPLVVAFLFVFVLSLIVRFLHIRNLVVPAWIDSVHHTLIAQLIVINGRVPRSYEPLLPIGKFVYHFGFHSLVAAFHWLTGLGIPKAMLILGQVINGLMVLSIYVLAKCLTGRRLAGLFAALVVGLISLMPAYYVSWGRYTQLTGLVLLPPAIVFTIRGLNRRPGSLMLAAVSAAGLLLTHYRVLIFYAGFVLAYLLYETLIHRHEPAAYLKYWGRAGAISSLAALLTLPWLVNLVQALLPLVTLPSKMRGEPSYNALPYELVMIGNNRVLIVLAICGLFWGLYKRERGVALTVLWAAILAVIANPTILGLPSTWLVNNASLVISLFVPLAVLTGYFLASLQYPISNIKNLILAIVITLGALWGAWQVLPIVNPGTVLATRDDLTAMEWIRSHIPSNAKFLINLRHWQGSTYVGTDGGYWIPFLTGRDTILPPAIYIYGSAEYVKGINDLAAALVTMKSFDAESTWRLLRDNGVTHVYIGARGGGITPQMFMGSSYYHPVYSNGAVWIFQLQE